MRLLLEGALSAFYPAGGTRWHAPRASRLLDRHPTRPAARCRALCGLETIGTLVRGEKPTCRRCLRVLAGRVSTGPWNSSGAAAAPWTRPPNT